MKSPYHFGKSYAGQTLDWLPTDTEESYTRMMQDPKHRAYFAEQGWDKPGAIKYRINRHGFRGDEFDNGPYLLALGCSFTLGTGLPEQDIWPSQVGAALNLKVANLAWGGSAADTCFRLAQYWVSELRPALVIMLSPPPDRFEIFLDQDWFAQGNAISEVEVLMPQGTSPLFQHDAFLKHWWLNNKNTELNRLKNELALKQLCSEYNIPCMIYCCFEAFGRSREEVGYARDYMHAGVKGHRMLADRMINDWNKAKH